jgi:hypothetical protein
LSCRWRCREARLSSSLWPGSELLSACLIAVWKILTGPRLHWVVPASGTVAAPRHGSVRGGGRER